MDRSEDIPISCCNFNENSSSDGDVKIIFNYTKKKEDLDKNLSEVINEQINDFKIVPKINNNLIQEILTCNTRSKYFDPYEYLDQASCSQSFTSQNENSLLFEKNGDDSYRFYVGQVIWGCLSKSKWFPCMIEELNVNGKVKVKYFNYKGPPGLISRKNIFEFKSLAEFWREIKKVRQDKKCANLTKQVLRAAAEASVYLTLPVNKRFKIFNVSQKLIGKFKDINQILSLIEDQVNDDEKELEEHLKTLFHALKAYDEKDQDSQKETIIRKKRSLSSERVKSPRYFCSDRLVEKVLKEMNPEISVKQELITIPKKKRIIKRPKYAPEVTLKERFLADIFDPYFEFTSAINGKICEKCLDREDIDTAKCDGISCDKWLHEQCFDFENDLKLCKDCQNCAKRCFVCSREIMIDNNEFVDCRKNGCKHSFHIDCLKKKYPDCAMSCPSHYCHACKSKTIRKNEKLALCIYCPGAYHPDVYCLPAGTQVLSKTQIICPRHKRLEELNYAKITEKNVGRCCICYEGGSIICCDGCPRSFHPECIQLDDIVTEESFMCNDCVEGTLPTYYSTVWAKVGKYRWWPSFVMLPWTVPLNVEKKKKFERQFCVRFFGTSDYYYVTCEQVFAFDSCGMEVKTLFPKSTNKKLDIAYNLAIIEAIEMVDILNKEYQKEMFTKPKPYRKILVNRPVPPIVLKKYDESKLLECVCKPTDESPCGKNSKCLNRSLLIECSDNCPAKEKCQNQQLKKRQGVELEIIKTQKCGFGVICNEDIEPNTFIIEYVGELIDKKECNQRMQRKIKRGDTNIYLLAVEANLYLDAEFYANKSRFINHSCDPNCISRKIIVNGHNRIGIFSKKFIPSGTELTFDYKMEYIKSIDISKCFCGSSNCSGYMGRSSAIKKKKLLSSEMK